MRDPLDILTEWIVWASLEDKKDFETMMIIEGLERVRDGRGEFDVIIIKDKPLTERENERQILKVYEIEAYGKDV